MAIVVATSALARPAAAHPMGNFSINHYARFQAQSGTLRLRYVLDFAEIPAADEMARLDTNGDNSVSAVEKSSYLKAVVPQFLNDLSLQVDGKKVALNASSSDLEVRPGAGGLPTLLVKAETAAPLPNLGKTSVVYRDENFAGRTGWMEIIAVGGPGLAIANSDAAVKDRSRELTIFPVDAGVVPPRQSSAQFSVMSGAASARGATTAASESPQIQAPATNVNTPQNRFTQSIADTNLTPLGVIWGLLFAFAFGAVHALSPGHGKTMVAAYLVGSRGTPRHAVTLGLVVTLTHTFGVFALGLALLVASRYILPEKLFPVLSALSGLLIFGVGVWLFMSRYQSLQNRRTHAHSHDGHTHSHDGHAHAHSHEPHSHSHDDEHAHSHEPHSHSHDDEHAHSHDEHAHSHDDDEHAHSHDEHAHSHDEHAHSHDDEEHSHAHAHGTHVHSHGGKAHSHAVPEGPITTKTLVALGVSGGIVPCPEALVVLLAAVKLHRVGYGMVLIVAFSLGLAAALIAIGMLVVSARQRMTRFGGLSEESAVVRYLPLGSAAAITIIGAALTLQATLGSP